MFLGDFRLEHDRRLDFDVTLLDTFVLGRASCVFGHVLFFLVYHYILSYGWVGYDEVGTLKICESVNYIR